MTAPRYKTTSWNGLPNYECRHCPYATLDQGLMIRHVRDSHPTSAETGHHEEHPLSKVAFASDEAAQLAIDTGMLPQQFAAYTPTGKSGYTLADVRRIAAARSTDATIQEI